MKVLAFDRESDGCYSSEMLCVEGLHILRINAYCNHNNDYGETFTVFGECDGTCKEAYKEPTDDDLVWRPRPEQVEVSDTVLADLLRMHRDGTDRARVEVPRSWDVKG